MKENYVGKSMVEVAIDIQSKNTKEKTFNELYNLVAEVLQFSDEEKIKHIAQFYTDVTASGDFVYCGDDKWDLKKNKSLDILETEFYNEHLGDYSEEDKPSHQGRRSSKKSSKVAVEGLNGVGEYVSEDLSDENESEDQSYENMEDDYEDQDDYDQYEQDFDSNIDDDYDEDEDYDDDFDEDKYNEDMDNYEDMYDDN